GKGSSQALVSNRLPEGTYDFVYSDALGWDLQPVRNKLVLMNPSSTGHTVRYRIDGSLFTMDAGHTQEITGKKSCQVEFGRGNERGELAHYTVTEGIYHFAVTSRRWELYQGTANPAPAGAQPVSREESVADPNTLPRSKANTIIGD